METQETAVKNRKCSVCEGSTYPGTQMSHQKFYCSECYTKKLETAKQARENKKSTVTEKERQMLQASIDDCFGDASQETDEEICNAPWTFSVIDTSEMSSAVGRGVISSLVKKGLIEVSNPDTEDSSITMTELGRQIAKEIGLHPRGWRPISGDSTTATEEVEAVSIKSDEFGLLPSEEAFQNLPPEEKRRISDARDAKFYHQVALENERQAAKMYPHNSERTDSSTWTMSINNQRRVRNYRGMNLAITRISDDQTVGGKVSWRYDIDGNEVDTCPDIFEAEMNLYDEVDRRLDGPFGEEDPATKEELGSGIDTPADLKPEKLTYEEVINYLKTAAILPRAEIVYKDSETGLLLHKHFFTSGEHKLRQVAICYQGEYWSQVESDQDGKWFVPIRENHKTLTYLTPWKVSAVFNNRTSYVEKEYLVASEKIQDAWEEARKDKSWDFDSAEEAIVGCSSYTINF